MCFANAVLAIGMIGGSFVQQSTPYEWNKKSILTTDVRIELPGIILEPGSYVIRLHESHDSRSLIQVLDRGEIQVLATIVAVPDHHQRPEGNQEFTFHEVRDEGPKAVKSWFYMSDLTGLELVYPKARAKELARATGSHVMASNNKDEAIVAITANGKEVVIDEPAQSARRKPQ